jgi:hypothetical protein
VAKTKPDKKTGWRNIRYACTQCGNEVGRDNLTVKRVEYATMGEGYKKLRVRTVAWLCNPCREADPPWSTPQMVTAPGNADLIKKGEK